MTPAEEAQLLRTSLAEAFAPLINDEEAMRFCKGLQNNSSEGDLGLETVPIRVVYSAMLTFARRREEQETLRRHHD